MIARSLEHNPSGGRLINKQGKAEEEYIARPTRTDGRTRTVDRAKDRFLDVMMSIRWGRQGRRNGRLKPKQESEASLQIVLLAHFPFFGGILCRHRRYEQVSKLCPQIGWMTPASHLMSAHSVPLGSPNFMLIFLSRPDSQRSLNCSFCGGA